MNSPQFQTFYTTTQKACLPGVWSKGVALARDGKVRIDIAKKDEIILRVKVAGKAANVKVNLWPIDGDYFCDCGETADPCSHVAASIAALKNGLKQENGAVESESDKRPLIRYQFVRSGRALLFERWMGSMQLHQSLISLVGGINSGRLSGKQIDATQDDFSIDRALGAKFDSKVDRATLIRLLPALKAITGLELDSQAIEIGNPVKGISAELRNDGNGYKLLGVEDSTITEVFENGVVLRGSVLHLLEDPGLTLAERQMLRPPGKYFSPAEIPRLITDIVPALERKIILKKIAHNLPVVSDEISSAPPRIVLRLEKTRDHTLTVSPSIVYPSEYSIKDPAAELALTRKLQAELHLIPGHRVEFRGVAAINFRQKAQDWEMSGDGISEFALEPELKPEFEASESGFNISFTSVSGKTVDTQQVLRAWKEDESHVPLLGGGYAPLPKDWFERFGSRINRLLAAKESNEGKVPSYLRPELVEVSEELGGEVADPLRAFKDMLENFEQIPEAELPADLQADLRHYQRKGINWLCFLRDSGMGALLADDMGLGKTLQALCAVKGKTLVITPTSVLHSWKDQIEKFRPALKVALYYGANRKLDPTADITLSTYGLLRQDRDKIFAETWDTAILDEAQLIKNPQSQVAQAAHLLKAGFKVTLSGTPVENSMEDLWSQFQFLNPGLLGSRADFQEEFAGPIGRGDPVVTKRLRTRIKPFILRRMKRDVAPELPPRTEVVLECELSESEQELYDALLASSRKEVMDELEEGGSVFHALELLLRLRQAVCHPALVPGQEAETSSKLELLADTLESSIAQGHRALVFSQWTSFLDLIGPRLDKMGIKYLRLDGSTQNRQEVVAEFQDPKGPPVMLLSLKAGGVGLTLTAADHVYLMDSWWNPAVEDQAADRAHRIGQENAVLVCRMIAQNTLEERILALQKKKQALSQAILEGSAQAVSLTRDDILALLQP